MLAEDGVAITGARTKAGGPNCRERAIRIAEIALFKVWGLRPEVLS
jgi:hypothetical protein